MDHNFKVIHVNFSDTKGGASIAAQRIHVSLIENGIDSELWVESKTTNIKNIYIRPKKIDLFFRKLIVFVSKKLSSLFGIDHISYFNAGLFGSCWFNYINKSNASIVHIHWLGNEFLSLKQLNHLKKPFVISLHDEWILGSGYHINYNKYQISNNHSKKYFLKFLYYLRRRYHNLNAGLICPSEFMYKRCEKSFYSKNNRILLGHPIIEKDWVKYEKNIAKKHFKIDKDIFTILYSSYNGKNDSNKRFDDFCKCINNITIQKNNIYDIKVLLVGNFSDEDTKLINAPTQIIGIVDKNSELSKIYSATNVAVISSKYESFGLVAQELCFFNVPVICYAGNGLCDFIKHKRNGYVVDMYDYRGLCKGIEFWMQNKHIDIQSYNRNILKKYHSSTFSKKLINFYKLVIKEYSNS